MSRTRDKPKSHALLSWRASSNSVANGRLLLGNTLPFLMPMKAEFLVPTSYFVKETDRQWAVFQGQMTSGVSRLLEAIWSLVGRGNPSAYRAQAGAP